MKMSKNNLPTCQSIKKDPVVPSEVLFQHICRKLGIAVAKMDQVHREIQTLFFLPKSASVPLKCPNVNCNCNKLSHKAFKCTRMQITKSLRVLCEPS